MPIDVNARSASIFLGIDVQLVLDLRPDRLARKVDISDVVDEDAFGAGGLVTGPAHDRHCSIRIRIGIGSFATVSRASGRRQGRRQDTDQRHPGPTTWRDGVPHVAARLYLLVDLRPDAPVAPGRLIERGERTDLGWIRMVPSAQFDAVVYSEESAAGESLAGFD